MVVGLPQNSHFLVVLADWQLVRLVSIKIYSKFFRIILYNRNSAGKTENQQKILIFCL